MKIRVIYTEEPGKVESVKENPGKIFAVVGPFEDFGSLPEVMDGIELIAAGYNWKRKYESRS